MSNNSTTWAIAGILLGLLSTGCSAVSATHVPTDGPGTNAQEDSARRAIEGFVDDLYRAFCFDPGGEADWESMRALFHPDACFASPIQAGKPVKVQGIAGFENDFRQWIQTTDIGRTGLHERVLRTRIDVFANIAHAYVTFEGFVPGEAAAQTLGVDSLQLVLDRGTWKLLSFSSQYVSAASPLPTQFAPCRSPGSDSQ